MGQSVCKKEDLEQEMCTNRMLTVDIRVKVSFHLAAKCTYTPSAITSDEVIK